MADQFAQADALERRLRPRLMSGLILWVIFGFFVLALIWAALAEVDKSVRAQGKVIPSAQVQTVSNLEGGIVEEVLVKTGQLVAEGEPLVRLSPTISEAELGSGSATLNALSAKVSRLQAEIGGQGGGTILPAAERALYQARQSELSGLINAGRARIAAASRAVSEAEAMLQSRRSQAASAATEVSALRPLVENGIEPRLSLTLAQGRANAAASEVSAAAATVARASANVAEARAALVQQSGGWRSSTASELTVSQAELSARRSVMPALADKVRRTQVTAPMAGRVNRVFVATAGGSVPAGSPLVEVVPVQDGLIVEVAVKPQDIASVHYDQPTQVSVTAYDTALYGRLSGRVIAISPDAIANERTGESHYLVRIALDRKTLRDQAGKPLAIGPGMTVEASLIGKKQSILSYLMSPLSKVTNAAFRE
jgi:adhesin transport system membrane fusion protein